MEVAWYDLPLQPQRLVYPFVFVTIIDYLRLLGTYGQDRAALIIVYNGGYLGITSLLTRITGSSLRSDSF